MGEALTRDKMEKQLFRLVNADVRRRAANAVMSAPEGHIVKITSPTRSLEANAALWAMLADISAQVVWHGRKLDSESWKHVFSSSLQKQDVVPNLDGTGFVVMGISTSKMTKREMSDLLELIQSFGAQHNIKWSY
jgi:hypothetical protein